MQDARHALEVPPGADPRVLPDPGLVEAGGAVALAQDLLVGSLEEAIRHLVPVAKENRAWVFS